MTEQLSILSESLPTRPRRLAWLAGLAVATLTAAPALAGRDRTPPTAPSLSVTEAGATHLSLSWTASIDDSSYITYQVFVNGSPVAFAGPNTSIRVLGLTPGTPYAVTVKARDNGINWSPASNLVTIATRAADPGDRTAPTAPSAFQAFDGGCGEAYLSWDASTDNVDPAFALRYEVEVNGVRQGNESTVFGRTRTVTYAAGEGINSFQIFAIDAAGNVAGSSLVTVSMSPLCE